MKYFAIAVTFFFASMVSAQRNPDKTLKIENVKLTNSLRSAVFFTKVVDEENGVICYSNSWGNDDGDVVGASAPVCIRD